MRWRKVLRRLGTAVLAITCCLAVVGFGCADRFILFPSRDPVDPQGAQGRFVTLGSRQIEVFTARSPGAAHREPTGFVLEFPGNATRAEDITRFVADRWGPRPVEVWVMNYPGYGQSTGPPRLRSIGPAAIAVYEELRRAAGDRPIIVAGNSLGTAPALYVANQRPVAGLILQNPPAIKQMILRQHGWWNLWLLAGPAALQVPSALDSVATGTKCTAPAIFLLAERDTWVLPRYQRMVVDAYGGDKHVIGMPDANHNDPVSGSALAELETQLDRLLAGAAAP